MNFEKRQIWQIAAGDNDRNYADLFLKNGIISVGPGYLGSMEEENIENNLKNDGITAKTITMLKKFAKDIKLGDLIVLRIGMSEVHGIGVIRSNYGWSEVLLDIDGWDICHFYYVEWIWAKSEGKPKSFNKILNRGASFQPLNRSDKTRELLKWIQSLPEPKLDYEPILLPNSGKKITIDELCQPLYDYGVSINNLSYLKNCIAELQALAKWYETYNNQPSEHETVTHLITPFLRCLGWTPQRIALEYQIEKGRADLALFAYGNRQLKYLTAIVEAKKFKSSCLRAENQVKNYAATDTNRLIVTDGIRYGIFIRENNGNFPNYPNAYLNLTHLIDAYQIYGEGCLGADKALWLMNADWRSDFTQIEKKILDDKSC